MLAVSKATREPCFRARSRALGRVGIERARHDARLGVGKELVAVAEQAARADENSTFMRAPTGVISTMSPLREPIFSMTAPTLSAGTSTTSRSMGSHFLPSMV